MEGSRGRLSSYQKFSLHGGILQSPAAGSLAPMSGIAHVRRLAAALPLTENLYGELTCTLGDLRPIEFLR